MTQLKHIVDSLNLKFKACSLERTYYAKAQGCGTFVELEGEQAKNAAKFLEGNPSVSEFAKAFPAANIHQNLLVLRDVSYDDKGKVEGVEFNSVGTDNEQQGFVFIKDLRWLQKQVKGKWAARFGSGSSYSKPRLDAFFFETEIVSKPLEERYARMVQYVDCMVDTTELVMLDASLKRESLRNISTADYARMSQQEKVAWLDTLRRTRVMGFCSMDNGPRLHALNIAVLAAETVNWDIFLRAHLDIINDRFQRMTDGSYAWEHRQTYLHELETLDINTLELILGISFRIENPSKNHYYGNIGRLGRAIAEAKNVEAIEKQILGMIADPALDDFNRLVMHNLFLSYIYSDKNVTRRKINTERFYQACKSLPSHLGEPVKVVEREGQD